MSIISVFSVCMSICDIFMAGVSKCALGVIVSVLICSIWHGNILFILMGFEFASGYLKAIFKGTLF